MSKLYFFFLMLLSGLGTAYGQLHQVPERLEIATDFTTVIIFPAGITDADNGSPDILMKDFRNGENVLRIKAGVTAFFPTNLTVLTSDSRLYQFEVIYNPLPAFTKIDLTTLQAAALPKPVVQLPAGTVPASAIDYMANLVAKLPATRSRPRRAVGDLQLKLSGIFLKSGYLYFQFTFHNKSNIPYTVEPLQFVVQDRRSGKRSSNRTEAIKPIHLQFPTVVENGQQVKGVAVFPVFTIADDKKLQIVIGEQNGDRLIVLPVKGRHLLKAQPL